MKRINSILYHIDRDLYTLKYISDDSKSYERLWNEIKTDRNVLSAALEVTRDKFDARNTFTSPIIVEGILTHPDDVDVDLYIEAVEKIYSDVDLARTSLRGHSYGIDSFLLLTILNHNLFLDTEQKAFAIDEAMNMDKTARSINRSASCEEEQEPVEEDEERFEESVYNAASPDIRYWILLNPGFNEDFEWLLYAFYPDEEDYKRKLKDFEWLLVGNYTDEKSNPVVGIEEVDEITPGELIKRMADSNDEEKNNALAELMLIRKMNEIRPLGDNYSAPPVKELGGIAN